MENKIETKFICLSEPAFFSLIDTLYERLRAKDQSEERWIPAETAMSRLHIKSSTTLQKLRDTGAIRFSQFSKKLIMYDRESVDAYLEKHAQKAWH